MFNKFHGVLMNNGVPMEKTLHAIRMTPDVRRKLKVKAALIGVPQGDLIEMLLRLEEEGVLSPDEGFDRRQLAWLEEHRAEYEKLLKEHGIR